MGTQCQTALQSGSGKIPKSKGIHVLSRQKQGRYSQLQTKRHIVEAIIKLFFLGEIYDIHYIIKCRVEDLEPLLYIISLFRKTAFRER